MVCGAKRIRSLYLPWMTGLTPKLSTTTPPKGLASLSTINQCRDYAPLQSRPPCLCSLIAAGTRSYSKRRAPEAGMVCGAKRIRSFYFPWMTGVTPRLSTTTPPEALASLSTINQCATMRLCRADLPASAQSPRLEPAPTAFLLREPTARREGRPDPGSSRWFVHNAGSGSASPVCDHRRCLMPVRFHTMVRASRGGNPRR